MNQKKIVKFFFENMFIIGLILEIMGDRLRFLANQFSDLI